MHLLGSDIEKLEQRYRVRLINSLSGYKSANLVGTVDEQGQENVSMVSSVVHIGAQPPLIGMIIRPDSAPRHTLENIRQTGEYTINQVAESFYQQAHQTSARYPKSQSEFEAVGLTPHYSDHCRAPYVEESLLRYGLVLRQELPLEINGTTLLIGEVKELQVASEAVEEDGFVDLQKIKTVSLTGLDGYHSAKRLARLSYAKPDLPVTEL